MSCSESLLVFTVINIVLNIIFYKDEEKATKNIFPFFQFLSYVGQTLHYILFLFYRQLKGVHKYLFKRVRKFRFCMNKIIVFYQNDLDLDICFLKT